MPVTIATPSVGILLLDKPAGMSSQQAVTKVSWLFGRIKAGHGGTLDPFATGMLPICLGRATKLAEFLLEGDKTYEATLALGCKTDTADKEGAVVETRPVPTLSALVVERVLSELVGEQWQTPPAYSALKVNGLPMYAYARKGVSVSKQPRKIQIQALSLDDLTSEQIRFTVTCSKGTYIRVLAEEIAEKLGTVGHLSALRRTTCKGFSTDKMVSLSALEALPSQSRAECLLPMQAAFPEWPKLDCAPMQQAALLQGKSVSFASGLFGPVLLMQEDVVFAIAKLDNGRVYWRKLVHLAGSG